jgi:CRISPR-associated exonuclease Cas4
MAMGEAMRRNGKGNSSDNDLVTATEIAAFVYWKSSRSVWPNHKAQMAVYFLLIEDQFNVRPTHGFIVCGDGTRHRIENEENLRAWVLDLAGQIRAARKAVTEPIPVSPRPGQCRSCGQRGNCGQARL